MHVIRFEPAILKASQTGAPHVDSAKVDYPIKRTVSRKIGFALPV